MRKSLLMVKAPLMKLTRPDNSARTMLLNSQLVIVLPLKIRIVILMIVHSLNLYVPNKICI